MKIVKTFIIAVLIAVTDAKGGDQQETISDDLEQRTSDLLTSISPEIIKSDVEITLSSLKTPEDIAEDATAANERSNGENLDKTLEDTAHLQSEQEATERMNSAEDVQKITHTSDDNASFIHVKEKTARQGSDEDYAEAADDQQRDGNTFMENSELMKASDELKNAQESDRIPKEIIDKKSNNEKEVKTSENLDSVAADDIQDLFKADTADLDVTTQSRRMLSFDHRLLDPKNIINIQSDPAHEVRSGQNNRQSFLPQQDQYNHAHQDHHNHDDYKIGHASEAPPFIFPQHTSLPPLSLFRFPGQPSHALFHPSDNINKPHHSLDKGLPSLIKHLHENQPPFNDNQNHHIKAVQKIISHPFEQLQPLHHLQPLQPLRLEQPSQPLHSLSTLQPLPSLQTLDSLQPLQTFQNWQPLQSLQSHHPPQLTSLAPLSSLQSATSFQPFQNKMDNMFSKLQDASQHPVHSEPSHQFSDLFQKNWNTVTSYNSYTGR